MNDLILSVDIGGSKIAAGIVYPDGRVDSLKTIPTEAMKGGGVVMERVIHLCQTLLEYLGQEKKELSFNDISIGISSAGQIDPIKGKVIYATDNLPGWTGMEIKRRLESTFGIDTFVENDVNCFALGEANFGLGQGKSHILCITVGTGIGGAIIIDGKLYRGWKGSAGELGHITIDYNGNTCNCGSRGCIETYASGPAIEKQYKKNLKNQAQVTTQRHQKRNDITCKDIGILAEYGDEYAISVLKTAGTHLGICLSGLLNLLNPEIVILGGGVLRTGEIYIEAARQIVKTKSLKPMRDTPIIKSKLKGNVANLLGASVVCRQQKNH